MLPQAHIETAYQFLNAAESYPAADAPLIKSEMLWCAAAHCVKAAANQYGLTNASHNDLFRVVRLLARRLSERALPNAFSIASDLHKNMYEGQLDAIDIVNHAATVRRFVNRMAAILSAYPRLPGRRTRRV